MFILHMHTHTQHTHTKSFLQSLYCAWFNIYPTDQRWIIETWRSGFRLILYDLRDSSLLGIEDKSYYSSNIHCTHDLFLHISSKTPATRLGQTHCHPHLGWGKCETHALILLKGTYHPFEFTSSELFLQISHNLLQSYLVCFQSVLLNGIFVMWFSF